MTSKFQGKYTRQSNIVLFIDLIYLNGVIFMVSIDRKVKRGSIIHITSQNEEEISKKLIQYYEITIQ